MHAFHAPYGVYRDVPRDPFELTEDAKKVRRFLEHAFLTQQKGPGVADIEAELQLGQERLWDALHVLERAVQVMFVPETENLVKVPPFSYVPTRLRARVADGRAWDIGCAGEACAFPGLVPGETVTVTAQCPDCWQELKITLKDGAVLDLEPATVVLHMGIQPQDIASDYIRTCDTFNFFASVDHVQAWEDAVPERRGIHLPVRTMVDIVQPIAKRRYWDYDRGSDSPGSAEGTLAGFASLGVDVSGWR